MEILEVGKQFPERHSYVNEGMKIRFGGTGFDLTLCAMNLTPDEIKAFRKGPLEIAFLGDGNPAALFAVKTAKFSMDTMVNFQLVGAEHQLPWLENEFNLIRLILIEKQGGIIKGMRALGMEHSIIAAIKSAFAAQLLATDVDKGSLIALNQHPTKDILRLSKHKQRFGAP